MITSTHAGTIPAWTCRVVLYQANQWLRFVRFDHSKENPRTTAARFSMWPPPASGYLCFTNGEDYGLMPPQSGLNQQILKLVYQRNLKRSVCVFHQKNWRRRNTNSHGFEKHAGNCQRKLPTRSSFYGWNIRRWRFRNDAWKKDWADRWKDIYLGKTQKT